MISQRFYFWQKRNKNLFLVKTRFGSNRLWAIGSVDICCTAMILPPIESPESQLSIAYRFISVRQISIESMVHRCLWTHLNFYKNVASIFWKMFGTRCSQVFGIICISGGYQDLLPGFYQGFTLNSLGMFRFQRGKPIRKHKQNTQSNYAQTLILVHLIVVQFGVFLVIARNPPVGFWRK